MKCADCEHSNEDYISGYSGSGMYRFTYCGLLCYDLRMVDPNVERDCENFVQREVEMLLVNKEVQNASGRE